MTPKPRLLMVGLSCLDHIWQVERFPPTQSRTPATAYRLQGGGPAATAAVTAAKLGAEVELWTIHGADAAGDAAKAELESFGVDCSQIRTPLNAETFVSAILVTPEGERYIFPYYSKGLMDNTEGLELSRVNKADCVLVDARHPPMSEAVLHEAKRLGIPTVGDFSNMRNWQLAQYIDYLIVSEECAAEVLGRQDPEVALTALRQFDEQFVGITLGEQGFIYDHQGQMWHIPAFNVKVVDTTGAGDVFHGAYAYGVASAWSVERCGLFASVTAALKCSQLGGRAGIPGASEVNELLLEMSAKEMEEMEWM